MKNLQQSFSQNSQLKISDSGAELSIYSGEMSVEQMAKQTVKAKAAFPHLKPEFFSVLIDRMRENGFSDERMKDAINNVIDNCRYPQPTMADFLSFDRRVKLYQYNQVCDMVTNNEAKFEDFSIIKISGEVYRIRKSDKVLYNILDEY